jgi:hypothetical protein
MPDVDAPAYNRCGSSGARNLRYLPIGKAEGFPNVPRLFTTEGKNLFGAGKPA